MMTPEEKDIGEQIAYALNWTVKEDGMMGASWYASELPYARIRACSWNPLGDWHSLGYLIEFITCFYKDIVITTSMQGELWKCVITGSDNETYTRELDNLKKAICMAIHDSFVDKIKWENDGF